MNDEILHFTTVVSWPFKTDKLFKAVTFIDAHRHNQPLILSFLHRQSIIQSLSFYFSALCMVIACVSFPFGWNSDEFRKVCGPESNRFEVGLCGLRWAYPLAIIGKCSTIKLKLLGYLRSAIVFSLHRWVHPGDVIVHPRHATRPASTGATVPEQYVQR